ncbi:HD domain-containing protein [Sinanaerobacter chloroacetimidivorans]|jgi:uncharacterized protein|uniref:HD domain-containing protein n=1 Tax=Sinanaerobacter chloroacetimidivorans TaxID=2818044 RepID=A0A8J7VWX7_9FIRM|nr:HD domain-containing protein [Sinanaerobacter chloroacetimidivorans]MBR0596567.1 HD domain-containing protein [Sinanaerobacter chloroacetimidivorans]
MANKHPSREECFRLLEAYHTPGHVIRHCVEVTDTALKIAGALNNHGYHLNLDLLQAAGLIHDIARVEEKHWEVGARIASELGYDQEAEMIRVHMFYNTDIHHDNWKEIDILCLSDRMVKEDQYVGLETRMSYVLEKFKDNPEVFQRLQERIKENREFIRQIEEKIGASIDSLM